jgi:hypothetical protein
MNVDTIKIGDYVLTSYSGRLHTLFNTETGDVRNILPSEYSWVKDNKSVECCKWVEQAHQIG